MFEDGSKPISEEIKGAKMAKQEKKANTQNQDSGKKQGVYITIKGIIALQEEEKAKRPYSQDGIKDQRNKMGLLHAAILLVERKNARAFVFPHHPSEKR